MKGIAIYDIEVYANLFLIVFYDLEEQEFKIFEFSPRRDDRHALMRYLKQLKLMVGFNNLSFDYPLVHEFVRLYKQKGIGTKKIVDSLMKLTNKLIHSENRWSNIKKNAYIKQLDLYLINHYDNHAKSTSLKILEFNMGMENIIELPYPPNSTLSFEQIDEVIDYCINDVAATNMFFSHNMDSIKFRQRMSKIYNHDFTNYNDVKMGERILLDAVAKGMNTDLYTVKQMRTYRDKMLMSDIIFPYIKFKTKPFKVLLEWWKDKIITETKGQFTGLDFEYVKPLLPYANNTTVKGKLKNLNIILNDFQFDFGTGGLHGALRPGIWKTDDEYEIILLDVSSYYPNLAYHNKLHPQHIPVDIFVEVIGKLYEQRMGAKASGDKEMVKAIKLALNGALYGKSNSEFSFMYDPQFMMSICVNGQLLLSMLAEQCILHGFELIQVNTDGVLIRLPKSKRRFLDNIVNQWMKLTNLKLDYDFFQSIFQRDVNNYMGVYMDGSIKYKGIFDFEYAKNGDWHKNFSALIVPKALKAYYVDGIEPEEFMENHDNVYDFFLRTKYNRNTKLLQRTVRNNEITNEVELQRITRYYVAKNGYIFTKVMPPLKGKEHKGNREFAVESGYLCREVNNLRNVNFKELFENIDFEYYKSKIYDVISTVGYKK